MTAQSLFAQAENLGTLDLGNNKIYVVALPTASNKIVVNYGDSSIKVSCALPAKEHKIMYRSDGDYDQQTAKIKAPPILFIGEYCDIPADHTVLNFYIFGLNTRCPNIIYGAPYMLANVYSSGRICFGSFRPKNLRAAYNQFWTTPFNSELIEESFSLVGYPDDYDPDDYYDEDEVSKHFFTIDNHDLDTYIEESYQEIYKEQPWEDLTSFVCGRRFWASPRGAPGVLVSNNRTLLKKIPRKYWRQYRGSPLFIARATKTKKGWNFFSGTVKFSLPEKNIALTTARRDEYGQIVPRMPF